MPKAVACNAPCAFLRPSGTGEIASVWHAHEETPTNDDGFRPWLSIDARFVPGFTPPSDRFLTILTNEEDGVSGRVDVVPALPAGPPLYAQPAAVLPPVDAVFACGSAAVERWLHANRWSRTERYNDNFADRAVAMPTNGCGFVSTRFTWGSRTLRGAGWMALSGAG